MRRSKHKRRYRRNRGGGSYAKFVKRHKSLFKRHSFGAATRKIAAMWRKKH